MSLRSILIPTTALLLTVGTGCTRDVCRVDGVSFVPMSAQWQAQKDLIPASATVCGQFESAKTDMSKTLHVDFASDPNPFVAIVHHLEETGLKRASEDTSNPDYQQVSFTKDKVMFLRVGVIREKRRVRAAFTLE